MYLSLIFQFVCITHSGQHIILCYINFLLPLVFLYAQKKKKKTQVIALLWRLDVSDCGIKAIT